MLTLWEAPSWHERRATIIGVATRWRGSGGFPLDPIQRNRDLRSLPVDRQHAIIPEPDPHARASALTIQDVPQPGGVAPRGMA